MLSREEMERERAWLANTTHGGRFNPRWLLEAVDTALTLHVALQKVLGLLEDQSHRPWSMQEIPTEYGCKDCGTDDCDVRRAIAILRATLNREQAPQ